MYFIKLGEYPQYDQEGSFDKIYQKKYKKTRHYGVATGLNI